MQSCRRFNGTTEHSNGLFKAYLTLNNVLINLDYCKTFLYFLQSPNYSLPSTFFNLNTFHKAKWITLNIFSKSSTCLKPVKLSVLLNKNIFNFMQRNGQAQYQPLLLKRSILMQNFTWAAFPSTYPINGAYSTEHKL